MGSVTTPRGIEGPDGAVDESPMDLTALELREAIRKGEITPLQSVKAALARIRRLNPAVNAFTYVCEVKALEEAQKQTERLKKGEDIGPLGGVPIGVKDLEDAKGCPTSYGCKVFKERNRLEEKSSPQVERLEAAGAIVVGKTNVPTFGSAAYSKNLAFGVTRNPWDLSRTSGGSSGGSAAAVASKMVPICTGSDAGGSIRIPATFVGCFGFKPTFGLIPQTELVKFGSISWTDSIHYGPLCRSVADAALYLDIVAGYHPADPKSFPRIHSSYLKKVLPPSTTTPSPSSTLDRRLKIGFCRDFGFVREVQEDILKGVKEAVKLLSTRHDVKEFTTSLPDAGIDWVLLHASQSYISIYPLVKDHADSVERGLLAGFSSVKDTTLDDLGSAWKTVTNLHQSVARIFEEYDVLVTPAMPIDAFAAQGPVPQTVDGKEIDGPVTQLGFLFPFNFTGNPACVLRCPGTTLAGLPCSIQLAAPKFKDDLLLQLASEYEALAHPFQSFPTQFRTSTSRM